MSTWRTRRKQLGPASTMTNKGVDPVRTDDPPQQSGNLTQREEFSGDSDRQSSPVATTVVALLRGMADSDRITLWLRRADQLLLGTLLIAFLVLLIAMRWKLSGGGQAEIEIASQQPREYFYSININRASWVEWAQLDGIGEKLAKRIVQDREERGPFRTVDDLRRVRGLGPKLVEKLTPFLKCINEVDAEIKEPR